MRVLGPYRRKTDNRQFVVIVKDDGKKTTMSYARWVLQQRLGRPLTADEEADHIDNDRTNDLSGNLQVLTPTENRRKEMSRRPKELYEGTCPVCGNLFTKRMKNVRANLKKGKSGPYCSRLCAGKSENT